MPLISVRAVYEHGEIKLLEKPPVHDRYEVLVTFLGPGRDTEPAPGARTFSDLKGILRGLDLSFEDIQAAEYKGPRDL